MKKCLIILFLFLSAAVAAVGNDYTPQLQQLASELSKSVTGTADGTFKSVEYVNGDLTFTVGIDSKFNKAYYAAQDPDKQNQYVSAALVRLFSGNPAQGKQIMDFLSGTRTRICFRFPLPGDINGSCSELTVLPSDIKALLK